jgi:hypothetical protein
VDSIEHTLGKFDSLDNLRKDRLSFGQKQNSEKLLRKPILIVLIHQLNPKMEVGEYRLS